MSGAIHSPRRTPKPDPPTSLAYASIPLPARLPMGEIRHPPDGLSGAVADSVRCMAVAALKGRVPPPRPARQKIGAS